jgi:hypothetical protein
LAGRLTRVTAQAAAHEGRNEQCQDQIADQRDKRKHDVVHGGAPHIELPPS